jgi:hypothetical protein
MVAAFAGNMNIACPAIIIIRIKITNLPNALSKLAPLPLE